MKNRWCLCGINVISKNARREEKKHERVNRQRSAIDDGRNEIFQHAKSGSRENSWSGRDNNGYGQRGNNSQDRTVWEKNDRVSGREPVRYNDVEDAQRKTSSDSSKPSRGSKNDDERTGTGLSEKTSEQSDGLHDNRESKESGKNDSGRDGTERSDLQAIVAAPDYSQLDLFDIWI